MKTYNYYDGKRVTFSDDDADKIEGVIYTDDPSYQYENEGYAVYISINSCDDVIPADTLQEVNELINSLIASKIEAMQILDDYEGYSDEIIIMRKIKG